MRHCNDKNAENWEIEFSMHQKVILLVVDTVLTKVHVPSMIFSWSNICQYGQEFTNIKGRLQPFQKY